MKKSLKLTLLLLGIFSLGQEAIALKKPSEVKEALEAVDTAVEKALSSCEKSEETVLKPKVVHLLLAAGAHDGYAAFKKLSKSNRQMMVKNLEKYAEDLDDGKMKKMMMNDIRPLKKSIGA